jgi:hypothetical protein
MNDLDKKIAKFEQKMKDAELSLVEKAKQLEINATNTIANALGSLKGTKQILCIKIIENCKYDQKVAFYKG